MTTTETATKVGDVFYRSWGYDQTNVDYYAVTGISPTGKTATFIAITGAVVSDEGSCVHKTANATAAICCHCMRAIRPLVKPDGSTVWRHIDNGQQACRAERVYVMGGEDYWQSREGDERTATPEVFKRRLKFFSYGGGPEVHANYNSYSSLSKWDGRPQYETAQGWGH